VYISSQGCLLSAQVSQFGPKYLKVMERCRVFVFWSPTVQKGFM
jgi:hypothetical protein